MRAEVLTVKHEDRDRADHRDCQKPARDKGDRSPSACRHGQQDDDRYDGNRTADRDGETETDDTQNQRLQCCCTPSSRFTALVDPTLRIIGQRNQGKCPRHRPDRMMRAAERSASLRV